MAFPLVSELALPNEGFVLTHRKKNYCKVMELFRLPKKYSISRSTNLLWLTDTNGASLSFSKDSIVLYWSPSELALDNTVFTQLLLWFTDE